jgi:hypothetical protein
VLVGHHCFAGRDCTYMHERLAITPQRWGKPIVPTRICADRTGPHHELKMRGLDIGPNPEADLRHLLARFIAVHLGGDHHIAEGRILNSTCDTDEGGYLRLKMPKGMNRNCRSPEIASTHLADGNGPSTKLTNMKPGAPNSLAGAIIKVPEHGFGLCLDCGEHHRNVSSNIGVWAVAIPTFFRR